MSREASPPIVFRQEGAWRVGKCLIPALDRPELLDELRSLCEQNWTPASGRYAALDLSGVSHLASPAIAMVLSLLKRQRLGGGTLALCGLEPAVAHVFRLARLDRVFELYPDLAALLTARPMGAARPVDAPPGP